MQSVEHLMQSLHKHGLGLKTSWLGMPFLRLPIPPNPKPEPISYEQLRKIYETLLNDLTQAEATLAKVKDKDVKLPLHMGLLRFDFNGDGIVDEEEAFWKIFARVTGNRRITPLAVERFAITFDKADVHWLRGYCHLLSALTEFILAHDWKESFDRTGHLFFKKVDSPFQFLTKKPRKRIWFDSETEIMDFIAFIHLINYPVKEPARMKSALSHLESVIAQSRENWKAIESETDDDNEWIPNPKQTGVIPGVRVTQTIIDGWKEFLDEAEAILKGDKLIPHWRVDDGRGINLRKVFTHPKRFDLILWIQGSAAEPFLEQGTLTEKQFWRRLQRNFGGNFFGFAVWFN
ncbi:MAG: hypothetical protein IID46_14550 [Planctomycetes bacterium]|nr:hypothetical protein [Planctomycetota bacterium]